MNLHKIHRTNFCQTFPAYVPRLVNWAQGVSENFNTWKFWKWQSLKNTPKKHISYTYHHFSEVACVEIFWNSNKQKTYHRCWKVWKIKKNASAVFEIQVRTFIGFEKMNFRDCMRNFAPLCCPNFYIFWFCSSQFWEQIVKFLYDFIGFSLRTSNFPKNTILKNL